MQDILHPHSYLGVEQNDFKVLKSVIDLNLSFRFGTQPKGLTHFGFSHTSLVITFNYFFLIPCCTLGTV